MSETRRMKLKIDSALISCLFHKGGENAIVFIHGFGSSKEVFVEAFETEKLQSFTMISTDLIGFGDSGKPPSFSYRLRAQASVLKNVIVHLGVERFHIVAHSMGGIVGIELTEMMPKQSRSLINLEGNLTIEDCTMSKQVAEMSERYFTQEGFENLRNSIAEESKKAGNESLKDYLKSLSKATAKSLHKSAISTVHESSRGDLLTRFEKLPFYKCYIYGEKNKGVFPAEKMLKQKGIPLFYVSNSGHSMMKENPKEFYELVLRIITNLDA